MSNRPLRSFADYYQAHRCPSAPQDPNIVLGAAQDTYGRGCWRGHPFVRMLDRSGFMDVLYGTLGIPGWATKEHGHGVFHDFNPNIDRYDKPVTERFMKYFKGRLKQALRDECERLYRLSDNTRLHPAYDKRIRTKPRDTRTQRVLDPRPTHYSPEGKGRLSDLVDPNWRLDERKRQVREAVSQLPPENESVIREHYYNGKPLREIGRSLDMDRRKLKDAHDDAIRRLRKTCV